MDINILKTFIEVYRTRHFGKAADNLFVTQSTVSSRIRQLEEELGVQLFSRNRNNIQLTPSGQRFLKHAESILTNWNRARFDVNIRDDTSIPIVIGAVPSIWDIYLGRWLLKAKKSFPQLSLVAEASSTDTMVRQLIDHTLDMGFTYDFPQHPDITVAESLSFELILVSSHKDLNLDEAIKSDYVYVDWGTSFANQHANYFPDAPVPSIRIGLGRVAREFIRKNGGSAYLPEPMIRNDLAKERLYRVKDAPGINRRSFVIYRENSERKDVVEKLISLNSLKR